MDVECYTFCSFVYKPCPQHDSIWWQGWGWGASFGEIIRFRWDHEDRTPWGINVFIRTGREVRMSSLSLSLDRKKSSYEHTLRWWPSKKARMKPVSLAPWFWTSQSPELWEIIFFKSFLYYHFYGIWLLGSRLTKTITYCHPLFGCLFRSTDNICFNWLVLAHNNWTGIFI